MSFRRIAAIGLVLTVIIAASVSLGRRRRADPGRATQVPGGYAFGLVTVDTLNHKVSFPAQVARDTGLLLLLLNLTGYRWLDDSAALTSPARLLDLQQAIASLDWTLWDSLWTGNRPGRPMMLTLGTPSEARTTKDEVRTKQAYDVPTSSFAFPDGVFLGMPEFDPIVLQSGEDADCRSCPVFGEESRAILDVLRRRSGIPARRIEPGVLPKPGVEVLVTIQFP